MTTNITLLTIAVGDILLPGEGSNAARSQTVDPGIVNL